MKTITKQLIFVLLVLFMGQNCAASKGCVKHNKCKQTCTTEDRSKCKKCKFKKCKSQRCKSKQYKSQKIHATTNKKTTFKNNADLSAVAANSLEIAQLRSQIQYLEEKINDLGTPQTAQNNPTIFSKKIVLDNGTTLIGNIIYRDNYWIQIETTIGTLSVDVNSIVRIVDLVPSTADVEFSDTLLELENNNYAQDQKEDMNAEVVLSGEIFETRDDAYNTMISGEVQNKGTKRADFAKITFTVYKNQNYNTTTKDYTVFIEGSTVAFEHGAVSSSSLYPNETGFFSVLIPSDFGPFISYSHRIDWETYE